MNECSLSLRSFPTSAAVFYKDASELVWFLSRADPLHFYYFCVSLWIPVWPSNSYRWWVVRPQYFCFSKSFSNARLRYLHPWPVVVVDDVTDCCLFKKIISIVSLTNLSSGSFYFSGHSKLLRRLRPVLVQWLWFFFHHSPSIPDAHSGFSRWTQSGSCSWSIGS